MGVTEHHPSALLALIGVDDVTDVLEAGLLDTKNDVDFTCELGNYASSSLENG